MRSTTVLSFLIITILLLIGCSKEDQPSQPQVVSTKDLLPQDKEISNWDKQSGTDASWLASNTTQLQEKINGGFELFANHGFVEAAMQKYSGIVNKVSNIEFEAQIYNQASATNADGVFDDPNNVFANPIAPINPPSAKAQITKEVFSYTMKFTKSKYYVRMTCFSADEKAQNVLEIFANNIASKIK